MPRTLYVLFLVSLVACDDDDRPPAPPAGDRDVVSGPVIEDLAVAETIGLDVLDHPVDVVFDQRGFPHVYAQTIEDAVRVQAYLMARDRMLQMEFFRRAVKGELAAVLGAGAVPDDSESRRLGFGRQAEAIWAATEAGGLTARVLEAFAEGVNVYIAELKAGTQSLPGSVAASIYTPAAMRDWTPVDTLAISRFQSFSLSFGAFAEIDQTLAVNGIAAGPFGTMAATDPSDPDFDPRLAARVVILRDLWPLAPAENAFTLEGYFGGGPMSRPRPRPDVEVPDHLPRASREALVAARSSLARLERLKDRFFGGGSNNWVVGAELTATGVPLLASDPHLSLMSPPIWWMSHINTAKHGGDWDSMGVTFAGIPTVVLGFNRHVAWGASVSNFDVTDVYIEVLTPGDPDTVEFRGQQIPVEVITETIEVLGGADVQLPIEIVPPHGPIVSRDPLPISVRWTGMEPSFELDAFLGYNLSENVDDFDRAAQSFEVGGQNFVAVDSSGNIFWTTRVRVPVRFSPAFTYDPLTTPFVNPLDWESGQSVSPAFAMPGVGFFEWVGNLASFGLPSAKNPVQGWIATANQDQVGVTKDGNPFNDRAYLGWAFNAGYRQARINEELARLAARGNITREEMQALQGDAKSPLGTRLAGVMVGALERAAETPVPADLAVVVAEAGAAKLAKLASMRAKLAAWTFATPPAVEGTPSAQEIEDSVATTIFNAILPRLLRLAFDDEIELIGVRPGGNHITRTIKTAMLAPHTMATCATGTQDPCSPGVGDTILWDDLETVEVETRDERIVRAAVEALDWLEAELGTDMVADWRWGRLHTLRFSDVTEVEGAFSIPPEGDTTFPDGFPRQGDYSVVDASQFDIWSGESYAYRSGPSQRLVVEMHPDGPRAWNALPGGQSMDPASPHHDDEAELWRTNQAPALAYEEAEVVDAADRRVRFEP